MTSSLFLDEVCIAYGEHIAVRDVSLQVEAGEVHVLLGHSGSGKTTILRSIAGFERVSGGEIRLAGDVVDGARYVAPERRPVGLVFQEYALFPHMSVGRNVAFGLGRGDDAEVRRLLALIGLEHRADAMPGELSGGEQQRVALARALARKPRLVLLDEPFSNLDPELRSGIRRQTFELIREAGLSTILVTHSAEEAMEVGDRISVLKKGRLLQTGTPRELYRHPRSLDVARALGVADAVPATCDGALVRSCLGELAIRDCPGATTGDGRIVLRPEDLVLGDRGLPCTVKRERFLGDRVLYTLDIAGEELTASASGDGAETTTHVRLRRAHWLG